MHRSQPGRRRIPFTDGAAPVTVAPMFVHTGGSKSTQITAAPKPPSPLTITLTPCQRERIIPMIRASDLDLRRETWKASEALYKLLQKWG